MNHRKGFVLRDASSDDARSLAELMNIGGEGIPAYLWSRMADPGVDVMEFGARRVGRTEGAFSFRNACVALSGDAIVGMLLSYRLPDPYQIGALEDYPDVVRPLVELEALAAGSWYVNAIATFASFRGQGVATLLMEKAESLARDSGADVVSLIVAEQNAPARKLYEKLGYTAKASRPIVQFPAFAHGGDWMLMTKPVESAKRQDAGMAD